MVTDHTISPTTNSQTRQHCVNNRVQCIRVFLLLALAVPTAAGASFSGTVSVAFVAPNKSNALAFPKQRRRQPLLRMQPKPSAKIGSDEGESSQHPSSNGFNWINFPMKTNGVQMNPLDDFDQTEPRNGDSPKNCSSLKDGASKNGALSNGASPKNGVSTAEQQIKNIPTLPNSQSLHPLSSNIVRQLPNGARVTLVGSGPGDPSLLTVAADRLLRDPTVVVIADRLVSPEIMETLATNDVHVARKWPGCAEQAQEEIYHWTYQALLQGRHVVRLKIGDPFVFGRGAEEILTFRKWGVEPKVIPGVSAALSAPLLGSIPVTHRGVANQVVICTGYGKEGTCPDLIRYHPDQTVVFLMAVGRLRELSQRLQTLAGYPGDMPVAIVERAACPNQRTIVGTLDSIGDIAQQYQAQAPSTIIVGRVVNVLLNNHQAVITSEALPEASAELAAAISAALQPSQVIDWVKNCTETTFVN